MSQYQKIAALADSAQFRQYCSDNQIDLPCDDAVLSRDEQSPLAQPIQIGSKTAGNRWVIHPMEGWDANEDGSPSDLLLRRWHNFGVSGAKLIFGGEAFAVRYDGRANPRQLYNNPAHCSRTLELLRETLINAHELQFGFGSSADFVYGLQLTHSGRYSRPSLAGPAPRIAYHHPILDKRLKIDPTDDSCVFTDEQLYELIEDYVKTARLAQNAGFDFVDVKHCHGYLGHELLSAYDRAGDFGGSLENRTRFMRTIIGRIRQECPGLGIGVRLSLFDTVAYQPDPEQAVPGKLGTGTPCDFSTPYPAFGCNRNNPLEIDLTEPLELVRIMAEDLKIDVLNLSAGSPYYNPHVQRPTYFPASDAYQPPEDPLRGVARQIGAVRIIKQRFPQLPIIGSGYTYLQDFLPQVAQAVVRNGWTDMVGIGRMVLCYPDLIADSLAGRPIDKKRICRTFSDCTTAPRNGIVSGCYPLDPFYRSKSDAANLKEKKAQRKKELGG